MEKRQKEELKQRVRQEPLELVVKRMGIRKKEAEHYLYKLWGREKYERIVKRGEDRQVKGGGGNTQTVRNWEWKTWFNDNKMMLALLTTLVMVLYLPFLGNQFLSDDIFGIVNEPKIKSFSYVFVNPLAFVRPLMYFFISNIFGNVPAMFRLVNIFSHILMVGAVYLLVELMVSRRVAQVAATLVAIHPIMIESVTWISGGGHSQYSLFAVVAVVLYALAREKKSQGYYYWSVGSYLLSLLFSEKALMLPGILVMYELFYGALRKGKLGKEFLKIWPYVGLSLFWFVVYLGFVTKRTAILATTFSSQIIEHQPLWQKVSISITEYLGLIIWPDRLTLYHSDVSNPWLSLRMRAGILSLLIVGLLWASIRGWQGSDKWRRFGFWGNWFIIVLIPTLTPWASAWIAAERYVYMGTVGVFVLGAWGWVKLEEKSEIWKQICMGVGVVVVIGLMGRTFLRNLDWRNQDYLWLSAERTSPSSPQNMNNLGDLYARRGDNEKALMYFKQAVIINPNYADGHHNLANIYRILGQTEEAKANYLKAAELNPGLWQSYMNLALIAFQESNNDFAIEYIEKAISIYPSSEELLSNAAIIYMKAGEKEKAVEVAKQILMINPGSKVARQVLSGVEDER